MKTLFLVYLIVEAIFGIGFLFFPSFLMDPMGVVLDETSTTFARMFGSLIISIPVLIFFVRKSADPGFKKGVIYSVCIYLFISTIIIILTLIKGLMNTLGWSMVVLHLAFFIWFGSYALTLKTSHAE
jgi:hypothetical protein